jgi:predicted unusual protein kinase regulating ubiquinone biosynthesis (AarF/ABC1/UbiB family)
MSNQLDLRLEAAHMRHFRRDFQKERNNIDFPVPIKGYVTKNALMEVIFDCHVIWMITSLN